MTLDHAEFIRRHHKPEHTAGTKKNRVASVWSIAFTALAYVGFCVATMRALQVHETVLFVFILLLLGALLGGYAIQLVIKFFSPQEKQRALLIEILEASQGARLITDSSNEVVLSNGRFDAMCKDKGGTSYDTLLAIFSDTEENRAHFKILADQAHRGLTDHADLKIAHGDHELWMRVLAQPVPGWAGYIHWRLDDITDEFVRNRSISEEREKLIDFTDNAPVGFFSVDERGRFVFVNATLVRWLGADLENILWNGMLHHFLMDPPESAAPYDIKEDGGARQVSEVRMKGPGGRVFLATINQTVVHEADGRVRTRGIVHDLTAERAMRQALEESEDRFRKFFKEAPLGIAIINSELVVEECNIVFADLLKKPLKGIEGHSFSEVVDRDDWQNAMLNLNLLRQEEESSEPLEIRLWSESAKSIIPARMYARKFTDSDKLALHFIDLTQQKNLENQFIQSQKMQAVGQLAGGIAHDFNNLLTAMIGFCDLLLLRHKPGDPSFSDIQQIKQNSNRATNLVRQLLAFSRQQTLRPKVQDITDILTELNHLMRRLIGANIDLKMTHGQDLGYVKVDGGQMEQVLVNMAVNARDAMPEGGMLTITTSHFTNTDSLPLGADIMPPGHWVKIEVEDTGSGIPPEIMQRIFEPFFTTKDVGQGTGLGLATVFGIVRQTGGYLTVHSEVNVGTKFSIYLPRLNEMEQDIEARPALEEAVGDLTGTARILLVEDEDAVRTFSTRALTNKGYEVETAESGEAGWTKFKGLTKPIDLLITDVIMPGMDGPTLAKQIRAEMPSLKIIFVSGYTEEKLKDQMGDGIHFLPKPFSLKQLAAKVKEVLDE
ncbi:MAG: PAS domain-containing sensor histidine kinase [Micavibrio aeruginosavorus]|uniref:histidine kinase n=1 Tax=Micavibrio aeruginosavorus TaxID=349221 RepID=A0A2W5FMH7_9BACT|nr:MAG: PAS domain-containing sensor histidine kinase [Micavibrio aeruginosavorus]